MEKDIEEIVKEYISEDPIKWGKLASEVNWRRLELMLLTEILRELRKLNSDKQNLQD
jgi:hypothetical protein